jgi:hypothetical protein
MKPRGIAEKSNPHRPKAAAEGRGRRCAEPRIRERQSPLKAYTPPLLSITREAARPAWICRLITPHLPFMSLQLLQLAFCPSNVRFIVEIASVTVLIDHG